VIVLDTNVVSELMRVTFSQVVIRWVRRYPTARLYTTSITQAEVLVGAMLLPAGRRRDAIVAAARGILANEFSGRVLNFGGDAANHYADIVAARTRSGHPISSFDAQIAAIARAHGAQIATRNIDDFTDCGIDVLDPWN
jgi:predicted nucleic acid-binding protein